MPSHILNIAGQRYGQLVALHPDKKTASNNWRWWCRCDCGATKSIAAGELRKGSTISCGCHRIKASAAASTKHGHAKARNPSPEYCAWSAMKHRCYRPQNRAYKNYGGRGIGVCPSWRESFEAFLRDVGPKPTPDSTLDRIDNNGDYEPSNVRWIDMTTQQRNRRNNHLVTYQGETLTITEWALRYGIPKQTLRGRLSHGWRVDAALTLPIDYRHSNKKRHLPQPAKKPKDRLGV